MHTVILPSAPHLQDHVPVCAQTNLKEQYKGSCIQVPNGACGTVMFTSVGVMHCSMLILINIKI